MAVSIGARGPNKRAARSFYVPENDATGRRAPGTLFRGSRDSLWPRQSSARHIDVNSAGAFCLANIARRIAMMRHMRDAYPSAARPSLVNACPRRGCRFVNRPDLSFGRRRLKAAAAFYSARGEKTQIQFTNRDIRLLVTRAVSLSTGRAKPNHYITGRMFL